MEMESIEFYKWEKQKALIIKLTTLFCKREIVKRREYVLDIYVRINVLYMLICYRYVIRNERC